MTTTPVLDAFLTTVRDTREYKRALVVPWCEHLCKALCGGRSRKLSARVWRRNQFFKRR